MKVSQGQEQRLTRRVGVAVVGAGRAGQAHAFAYRLAGMHPDLESVDIDLVAIIDTSESLATSVARRFGFAWASTDAEVVFCVRRGERSRLSTSNYRRVYRQAAELVALSGLDLHGPHDLRATYANLLEVGGIPPRVIDELMGHRSGGRGQVDAATVGAH